LLSQCPRGGGAARVSSLRARHVSGMVTRLLVDIGVHGAGPGDGAPAGSLQSPARMH
jgi:hypothetical protein